MNYPQQQQALRSLPIQEDFYLLDVVGGATITALHPSRPVVAYNSGCMIIVYDLMTDQKINLVHHQHEIYAIAFSPPGAGNSQAGGDYLVTIDFDRNDISDANTSSSSTMCLWNWSKGQCLQEIQIPKSQNNTTFLLQPNMNTSGGSGMPRYMQITFEKVGGNFIVLESGSTEIGGGYRATLWNLNRHQKLEMLSQMDLELQNTCLGIAILPKSSSVGGSLVGTANPSLHQSIHSSTTQFSYNRLRFLTLEKQTIKFWEYAQGHTELVKKIQIKQTMKQIVIADLTGFLLILGENGRILILDQEGEFVSSIARDLQVFSVIGTAHDKLLLGTERGTVCVYHLASLQFINEIPYQLSLLQNFQLNSQYSNLKKSIKGSLDEVESDVMSVFKIGPPVTYVSTTQNNRFLMIKYQDSSFVMIDRTVQNPQQSIMGYQFGHFQKVTGIQWMSKPGKRTRHLIGESGGWQISQSTDTFVTCSHDMSVYLWKHFGDRWSFSFIDVVKCFDHQLNQQRKQIEKSTSHLKLTSIVIYPRQPYIAIGDNKGVLRIFQISHDKALYIASHQLLKSLVPSDQASYDDSISEIHLTSDEQYAIIAFQSGLICCYDVKNSYNLIGQIEKDAQRFCYANQLNIQLKILETSPLSSDYNSFNSYDMRKPQDQIPYLNTSYETERLTSKPFGAVSSFRVLSTTSPNSISLRQVDIKGNKLNKTPLSQFSIDEGKISGFDVHPSKDYLLVTSTSGRIYVYRIDTGELRGTIKIPLHSRGCTIDPSGLYVVIQVPPFNPKHTANIMGIEDEIVGGISTHENDIERTTLLMFEIGTGIAAAEIKSVFEISSLAFSEDGRYLSLGSTKGSVCVWAVGDHLFQNIKQVLDSVALQSDFWCNYPIFLPDYGQYGLEPAPINQFMQMPVETNVLNMDYPENFQSPLQQPLQQQLPLYMQYQQQQQQYPTYQQDAQKSPGSIRETYDSPYQRPPVDQGIQVGYQRSHIAPPSQSQRFVQPQQQVGQNTIDRSIQPSFSNLPKQQLLQQQAKGQQPQPYSSLVQPYNQQKFYRKTFVEDQQTQITPHQSQAIKEQQQQRLPPHQSTRSAQIQTLNQNSQKKNRQVPEIPDYVQQNVYQRGSGSAKRPLQQYFASQSSLESPNKAELLYQEAYLPPQQQQYPFVNQRSNPAMPPVYSVRQMQQSSAKKMNTQSAQQLDYIDRTINNRQQPTIQSNRQIFYEDDNRDNFMPYEENLDAANLYNPFSANLATNEAQNLQLPPFMATKEHPLSSIQTSPIKGANYGSRLQTNLETRKPPISDPVDIDDDVSDHGPDSIQNQLQQLDGMNKYLQHIRVPTSKTINCQLFFLGFANDEFINVNGNNAEKAYTLERMRQEERLLEAGYDQDRNRPIDEKSQEENGSSTYDLVEEMYENMNSFDRKLKTKKYDQ